MSRENEPDFGDAQDEIRWLRDGISAERRRREEAEGRARGLQVKLEDYMRADKALTSASERWKARAELAERERDAEGQALGEAKQHLRHLRASHKEQCDARERAEADNAALLQQMHAAAEKASSYNHAEDCAHDECMEPTDEDYAPCTCAVGLADALSELTDGDHPGAALLERMRTLESVARQIIEHWETKPRAGMECIVIEARIALKEKP